MYNKLKTCPDCGKMCDAWVAILKKEEEEDAMERPKPSATVAIGEKDKMKPTTCAGCFYYDYGDSTCRVNPPEGLWEQTDYASPEYKGFWPTVKGEDWCGKGEAAVFYPAEIDIK
jgi:hypothetical protein